MRRPAVLLISSHLGPAFRELGCEVLNLWPGPGPLDLGQVLAEHGFTPDLLLQEECLSGRVVLLGLDALPCPRLFRALDPHLNLFWQVHYGRLFDCVLSTQRRSVEEFHRAGLPDVRHLPWHGLVQPWIPFAERGTPVAFFGRITPERPIRQAFAELLRDTFDAAVREVPYEEMFPAYLRTRIAPNEAILGELNFRLFEAASAGCLVLNPDIGQELAGILDPGREVEVFSSALDLAALVRRYLARPAEAERIGRAAWERVQAEHLPANRARAVLDLLPNLVRRGASGAEADTRLRLALFELARSDRLRVPLAPLEQGLEAGLAGHGLSDATRAEATAALLALWAETDRPEPALGLMARVLAQDLHQESLELNLTGSMAALRMARPDLARAFLRRQLPADRDRPVPADLPGLYLAWAGELARRGLLLRQGFPFAERRHLPASAFECLLALHLLDPGDLGPVRRMEALLERIPGTGQVRLSFLSHLALHAPQDWRLGLKLGLLNLTCFRLGPGLEELLLARDRAGARGEEERFLRTLSLADPSGLALKALAEAASGRLAPGSKTA